VGVPWGIEHSSSRYGRVEEFLKKWTSFAELDICRHFAVPFDDDVHTFTHRDDGTVSVSAEARPDLLAEIRGLSCGDGGHDEFGPLTEASLFVPDQRGKRSVSYRTWPWMENIIVDSLQALRWMGSDDRRLARELHAAGQLAERHHLMVSISY
jgi:hypothetical protein